MNEGKKQGIEKFIYGKFIAANRMFVLLKTGKTCHFAVWQQRSADIPRAFKGYPEALELVNVERNRKNIGQSVPLKLWSGPEASRKLRFPDFMTTAQEGGKVVSLTHRPRLPSGNSPGTHFC